MDQVFEPVAMLRTAGASVSRGAVLYRFYHSSTELDEVAQRTLRLQKLWRYVATRLHDYQDPGSTSNSLSRMRLQYLRNCCPAFLVWSRSTRYCRERQVCPFCYARQLQAVWVTVCQAVPKLRRGVISEFHLIERVHRFKVGFSDSGLHDAMAEASLDPSYGRRTDEPHGKLLYRPDDPDLLSWLQLKIEALIAHRRRWYRSLRCEGAYTQLSVSPRDDCWAFEQRGLFLVRPGAKLPRLQAGTTGRFKLHERPTRRVLARAVMRTFAYPVGRLRGDPFLVYTLLQALSGQRTSAAFGRFRLPTGTEEDPCDSAT